jgi:hypothetical protein
VLLTLVAEVVVCGFMLRLAVQEAQAEAETVVVSITQRLELLEQLIQAVVVVVVEVDHQIPQGLMV